MLTFIYIKFKCCKRNSLFKITSFLISLKDNLKSDQYKIVIIDVNTNQKLEYFHHNKNTNEFIMTIMNKICFDAQDKKSLDGNFISIYDEKDNRFHYFVHRLKGQ